MTETTEASSNPSEAVKVKIPPKLTPDRFKSAEYTRNIFAITPAAGTSVEHLLRPEYWAHVASKLVPHTRIEAISEDNAWFAEYIVLSNGPTSANVKLLRYVSFEAKDLAQLSQSSESQFDIIWAGVKARHRVVRKSDKAIIKEGFSTRPEAITWLRDYEVNSLIAA